MVVPNAGNWLLLGPLVAVVYVTMRLEQMRHGVNSNGRVSGLLNGVMVVAVLFAMLSIGLRYSPTALFWPPLLLYGLALSAITARKSRRMVFVEMLIQAPDDATRGRILWEWAQQPNWFGRRAGTLMRMLESGRSLASAVDVLRIPVGLYGRARWRIIARYGQPGAQRGDWKARDADQHSWTLARVEQEIGSILGRLAILAPLILIFPVLSVLGTFVTPTLIQLAQEFGLDTGLLEKLVGSFDVTEGWYPFVLVLSLVGGPSAPLLVGLSLLGMLFVIPLFLIPLFPQVWRWPGLRWLLAPYDRAVALIVLNEVLGLERELLVAVEQSTDIVDSASCTPHFRRAVELLRGGHTLEDALVQSGVIESSESAVLSAAAQSDQLEWGIEQIARERIERLLNRLRLVVQMIILVGIGCAAVLVGLIGYKVIELLTKIALAV